MKPPSEISDDRPPGAILLGRQLISVDKEKGVASLSYVALAEFTNRHGTVQGGFLAAMLDSATGATAVAMLGPGETAVTRELNTAFVRPTRPGAIMARVQVTERDQSRIQLMAELLTDTGEIVARATASLKIVVAR